MSCGGSSPRVRGKGRPAHACVLRVGIIPAGAGKRDPSRSAGTRVRDHPRGCGEKRPPSSSVRGSAGSSPRVRGKVSSSYLFDFARGIIPAGAGKSSRPDGHQPSRWDHPRGCGEKSLAGDALPSARGSSPRVRGKECPAERGVLVGGIIPAGAGKRLDTV